MADLDAILDQALDDFEEQELSDKAGQLAAAHDTKKEDEVDPREEAERNAEHMHNLLREMEDPRYGSVLQNTLKSLSQTKEGSERVDEVFERTKAGFSTNHKPSFLPDGPDDAAGIQTTDFEVAETLSNLAKAQQGMQGFETGKIEDVGETMMEDMMAQFQALGDKEDYHEVIDGVMRQLLSKDLMYDPIQKICDKFPEWLALHKANLHQKEYENYGNQYQVFQRLLAVYDTEPDNFPRLMELMFDMQHFGQPPADIIRDLAPGLKFDENGMPIMPNMGAGMVPEMPGGEGLPNMGELANQMATGQCSIM